MNFGYLSGNDLVSWCEPQLLISRLEIQPKALSKAVAAAISEVQSKLINVYDLTVELLLTDTLDPVAHTTIAGGIITGAVIDNAGSGWTSAPDVDISNADGDTTGNGASITAQISNSTIQKIVILSPGCRYTSVPDVALIGGGGTGAMAEATVVNGMITTIQITNAGTGYTSTPSVPITGGGGIGAVAVAVVDYGEITGLTIVDSGAAYTEPPLLSFSGGSQVADQRNAKLVKIISIFAVNNAMGPMQAVSEKMIHDYKAACKMIDDIRGGDDNLSLYRQSAKIRSNVQVVKDSFRQIG